MASTPLIQSTPRGLHCEAGGFYIDPWQPVDRAVITHGHSDHARPGSHHYLCARPGVAVLQQRLQPDAAIEGLPYGEPIDLHGVRVSFHPAGHLLGSAQVRVEHRGRVAVVSGDYKREPDPTCTPFEPVRCDEFVTESTFGLPIYRWRPQAQVVAELDAWWQRNQERGRTSVVFAYALGKAQRVLAALNPNRGPIGVHGAVMRFVDVYRAAGVPLPDVVHANADTKAALRGKGLIIAPPSALGTPWLRKFGPVSTAYVSGWMQVRGQRRWHTVDRGFVLSDHADWPGLLEAIDATGAERIGVTHGYVQPLVRYLTEQGRDAHALASRYHGERDEPAPDARDDAAPTLYDDADAHDGEGAA